MKFDREPKFSELLKVLHRQEPESPRLFEFFMNENVYDVFAEGEVVKDDEYGWMRRQIRAFANMGYDYYTLHSSDFSFPSKRDMHGQNTFSLNDCASITNREEFEKYEWPDPEKCDYSRLETLKDELPEGMKFIVYGPCGVLENVVEMVGYENLCYMMVDDPELVEMIFNEVGKRILRYYELSCNYDSVGAMIVNDDMGFNTQTFLKRDDMIKYVLSWHKKIVEVIHNAGKPAILHSCGQLDSIMDYIIDECKFDAKHSYEDSILPVEEAYEKWGSRIAILGGIDLNFVCTKTPEEIKERCYKMLERVKGRGGYALGTGNSVPKFVPTENFIAMIETVAG